MNKLKTLGLATLSLLSTYVGFSQNTITQKNDFSSSRYISSEHIRYLNYYGDIPWDSISSQKNYVFEKDFFDVRSCPVSLSLNKEFVDVDSIIFAQANILGFDKDAIRSLSAKEAVDLAISIDTSRYTYHLFQEKPDSIYLHFGGRYTRDFLKKSFELGKGDCKYYSDMFVYILASLNKYNENLNNVVAYTADSENHRWNVLGVFSNDSIYLTELDLTVLDGCVGDDYSFFVRSGFLSWFNSFEAKKTFAEKFDIPNDVLDLLISEIKNYDKASLEEKLDNVNNLLIKINDKNKEIITLNEKKDSLDNVYEKKYKYLKNKSFKFKKQKEALILLTNRLQFKFDCNVVRNEKLQLVNNVNKSLLLNDSLSLVFYDPYWSFEPMDKLNTSTFKDSHLERMLKHNKEKYLLKENSLYERRKSNLLFRLMIDKNFTFEQAEFFVKNL
jgi:hypothetical protein